MNESYQPWTQDQAFLLPRRCAIGSRWTIRRGSSFGAAQALAESIGMLILKSVTERHGAERRPAIESAEGSAQGVDLECLHWIRSPQGQRRSQGVRMETEIKKWGNSVQATATIGALPVARAGYVSI